MIQSHSTTDILTNGINQAIIRTSKNRRYITTHPPFVGFGRGCHFSHRREGFCNSLVDIFLAMRLRSRHEQINLLKTGITSGLIAL